MALALKRPWQLKAPNRPKRRVATYLLIYMAFPLRFRFDMRRDLRRLYNTRVGPVAYSNGFTGSVVTVELINTIDQ